MPAFKLDPKDREKYFNKNKTSCIDYPKGIPEIERYLIAP
jgi:hypothetical protein